MGKGVKSGKSCGKVCSSLYIEYIIKEYKGKQRKGKKVAGKVRCGKECSLFVYRYSIIEIRKRKGWGKDSVRVPTLELMFIIYRYIERLLL